MKPFGNILRLSSFTMRFAAVVGLLFCLSGPAQAKKTDYSPLAGEAKGNAGLHVSWKVEDHIPGKTKDAEDTAWLIVTPVLDGKTLPPLYQEGEYFSFLDGLSLPLVMIEDYNFDGYEDLKLMEGLSTRGAYGNIFLFDPKAGRFEANENFNAIFLETVDKENERLISLLHSSACDTKRQEFIVKGFDQLELVFEEGTECPADLIEKNEFRSFTRTYKDGKVVSEKTTVHQLVEE